MRHAFDGLGSYHIRGLFGSVVAGANEQKRASTFLRGLYKWPLRRVALYFAV